jgi:FlaA1/EpsC-like NDP-sugar epimerase
VDAEPKEQRVALADLTILGPPQRLLSITRAFEVERVIIAFSRNAPDQISELIQTVAERNVQVDVVPRYFELFGARSATSSIEGIPLMTLPRAPLSRCARAGRRVRDVLLRGLTLVLLAAL